MSCSICLEDFAEPWKLVQFGCCSSGIMCKPCLDSYLNTGKTECPGCKTKPHFKISNQLISDTLVIPDSSRTEQQMLNDYVEMVNNSGSFNTNSALRPFLKIIFLEQKINSLKEHNEHLSAQCHASNDKIQLLNSQLESIVGDSRYLAQISNLANRLIDDNPVLKPYLAYLANMKTDEFDYKNYRYIIKMASALEGSSNVINRYKQQLKQKETELEQANIQLAKRYCDSDSDSDSDIEQELDTMINRVIARNN